jgi:hypothetical protein
MSTSDCPKIVPAPPASALAAQGGAELHAKKGLPANRPTIFLGPDDPLALPTVAAHFLAWFVTASVLAVCNLFHSFLQHLVGNATTLQSIRKAACSVLIKLSLVAP